MTNKHMKRHSTSLSIMGMKIKSSLRYYHTPIRMEKVKNNSNTKYWQDVEKLDHSDIAIGAVK